MDRPLRKHRLEFALFKTLRGCFRVLPMPLAYLTAETAALLAQEVFGWRKTTSTARMMQVFPRMGPREITRLRHESARNLGRNLVEILRSDLLDDRWADAHIEMNNALDALQQARTGKGVLLVIAHFGNWDLAGTIACRRGIPMCFIARKQKNTLTYEALVQAREHSGGIVIDRDDPKLLRKVLQQLQSNAVVVILIDIRARTGGESFLFMGQKANIANGLSMLAAKSGAPVLPIVLRREGRNRQIWQAFPAQRLDAKLSKDDKREVLQICLDQLSSEILKHPASYFWVNKKWVLDS